MELTRRFSAEQYDRALKSWSWLGLDGLTPGLTSAFGDIFLRDVEGAVWFLDTLGGALERQWPDIASFQAELATEDGQDRFLLGGLALAAGRAGLEPGPDEVLDFAVSPVIGGAIAVDNLTVMSFVVKVDIAGQLHRQFKDMPPGTKISGITVS